VLSCLRHEGHGRRGRTWRGRDSDAHQLHRRVRPVLGDRRVAAGPQGRLTIGVYLTEMWLPSMASQVRATTLGGYRHNVRAYIVSRLGDIPLQRLTTARVGAFYGELVASGGQNGWLLSPKTVRYVHTTLRRALRDAMADGLVVRNVAAQARPPRARRVETHTWTAAEVGAFLASVREDRLYTGWLMLATLGLRRGELLGLRWSDADLTTGRIAIRHTLVMVDGNPLWLSPRRPRVAAPSRWLRTSLRQSMATAPIRRPNGCPGAWITQIQAWSSRPRTVDRCTQRL
jgi:integrase